MSKNVNYISFFLFLIPVFLIAQSKMDSISSRWVFELSGGLNTTTLDPESVKKGTEQKKTNMFLGMSGIYSIVPEVKFSFGASYHHFSYDKDSIKNYNLQMILLPIHLIASSNEKRKIYLHLQAGPEFGLWLNRSDLRWKGFPVFLSGGGNINYHNFKGGGSFEAGWYYSYQINPFRESNGYSSFNNNGSNNWAGNNSAAAYTPHVISYVAYYIGFKLGI